MHKHMGKLIFQPNKIIQICLFLLLSVNIFYEKFKFQNDGPKDYFK